MDSNVKNLDINGPADEITEYIDRLNFWIDTRGTIDEKAIKGGRKGSIHPTKNVGLPQTLRDVSVSEIQEVILLHVRPAQFGLVEWAVSHTGLES